MATDYVPLILLGGLAIGGFILWQNGTLTNLLSPPAAAPAPTYPASGVSSTTTPSTPTTAMGIDIITGQPCPCGSSTSGPEILHHRRRVRDSKGREQIIIVPSPGVSSTCICGGTPSSILGGAQPSQFTSPTDLNNFIGSSIAQAGYRIG